MKLKILLIASALAVVGSSSALFSDSFYPRRCAADKNSHIQYRIYADKSGKLWAECGACGGQIPLRLEWGTNNTQATSSVFVTNTASAEVRPDQVAQLLAEFEEWRTNDVVWLGSPITGQSIEQRADVQLGLRRDGVVVWRSRK